MHFNSFNFQSNSLTNNQLDDFLRWQQEIKDYYLQYEALSISSRSEMSAVMKVINAQFLSQIAITVDELNLLRWENRGTECVNQTLLEAGIEIQEAVRETIADFELIYRDYYYLLMDALDQFTSFIQNQHLGLWTGINAVRSMFWIHRIMETEIYDFYIHLFDAQIEEIIIDMNIFNALIDETKRKTFGSLRQIILDANVKIVMQC